MTSKGDSCSWEAAGKMLGTGCVLVPSEPVIFSTPEGGAAHGNALSPQTQAFLLRGPIVQVGLCSVAWNTMGIVVCLKTGAEHVIEWLWSQCSGKLRQDNGKFEPSLGNLWRSCLKIKNCTLVSGEGPSMTLHIMLLHVAEPVIGHRYDFITSQRPHFWSQRLSIRSRGWDFKIWS